MGYLTKVKKMSQTAGTHSGWNRHVNKYTKQKANKRIRRILRKEEIEHSLVV